MCSLSLLVPEGTPLMATSGKDTHAEKETRASNGLALPSRSLEEVKYDNSAMGAESEADTEKECSRPSTPRTPTTPASPATVTRLLHISLSGIREYTPGSFAAIHSQRSQEHSMDTENTDNASFAEEETDKEDSGAAQGVTKTHEKVAGSSSSPKIKMAPASSSSDLRRALFHCKISNEMLVRYDKYQKKVAQESSLISCSRSQTSALGDDFLSRTASYLLSIPENMMSSDTLKTVPTSSSIFALLPVSLISVFLKYLGGIWNSFRFHEDLEGSIGDIEAGRQQKLDNKIMSIRRKYQVIRTKQAGCNASPVATWIVRGFFVLWLLSLGR